MTKQIITAETVRGFGGQLGVAAEGAHDAMRFKRMAEEVAGAQLGTAAALDTGRSGAATHEIEGRSRVPGARP